MILMTRILAVLTAPGRPGAGPEPSTAALIEPALAGDRRAAARLVKRLMPVIRSTAWQVLRRNGHRRTGPHDADDLAQAIWLLLIKDDGRRLRAYDPARARTLEGYVAMVTRTESAHILARERAARRGGDAEHTDIDDARGLAGGDHPEASAIGAELAERLRGVLRDGLSERGQLVFAHVYVDGRTPAEAAALMQVNTQVVYNWQHKIRGLIRAALGEGD